jgi:hypothetical protein
MGPVTCINALIKARGPAVGPAAAEVCALLDRASDSYDESGIVDGEWCIAAVNAAIEHLGSPGVALGAHGGALLSIASRALRLLRASAQTPPGPSPNSLQYSLIRKLVGGGAHAAALAQGWELFDALAAAGSRAEGGGARPRTGGSARQQQQEQQQQQQKVDALTAGAVINLVVCTAEAGVPEPDACARLGAAVSWFAELMRCGCCDAASQGEA